MSETISPPTEAVVAGVIWREWPSCLSQARWNHHCKSLQCWTPWNANVHRKFVRKHPAMVSRHGVLMLHDITRPHVTQRMVQALPELQYETIPHPSSFRSWINHIFFSLNFTSSSPFYFTISYCIQILNFNSFFQDFPLFSFQHWHFMFPFLILFSLFCSCFLVLSSISIFAQ